MYETNDKMCPVSSFEAYLSHLHPVENALWQSPLDKMNPLQKLGQQVWYYRAPLGQKQLGNMMVKISTKYQLSERYTNHSIRVTSLQIMENNHIEGRHREAREGREFAYQGTEVWSQSALTPRGYLLLEKGTSHRFFSRRHAGNLPSTTFQMCPDTL